MEFNEKVLEDIIWDNSQSQEGRELLEERGLLISGKIFRQVELGNYGRADIITFEYLPPCVNIVVYELKKGCINVNALMQAARYVTALKRHGFKSYEWNLDINYSIRLIGDSIDKNGDFAFLYNILDNVVIYTYEFSLSGLNFKEVRKNWSRTEENLNNETTSMITCYLEKELHNEEEDDTDK